MGAVNVQLVSLRGRQAEAISDSHAAWGLLAQLPENVLYWHMQVILTADDFGRSLDINAAILLAHREGVLGATSLMVTAPAWQEAVSVARNTPHLAVGLHTTVVYGQALLPPKDIPHLVDSSGRFPMSGLAAGLRYAFSGAAQRELALELEAQFERFASTGLPLSHVDGHTHMHMHPVVLKLVLPLAQQYGAAGIRVPGDDLTQSLRYERRHMAAKLIWTMVFGGLRRSARTRLQQSGLVVADKVFGLMQSGRMREEYVIRVLQDLDVDTAELYFHPAATETGDGLGPNPGDLATLLSPRLRQVLQDRNIRTTTYPQIRRQRPGP